MFAIRNLKDGLTEREDNISLNDLRNTVDITSEFNTLIVYFQGDSRDIALSLGGRGDYISVSLSAESPESLYMVINKVKLLIGTTEVETTYKKDILFQGPTIQEQIDELHSIIEEIRAIITKPGKMLRCFLSYRFDSNSEAMILRLQRFLTLLGVEVVSGASYEPRKISDKVMERISKSIDFIILIVAESGESAWTRDEISFANSRAIPIVPVVEQNAKFESGMFGDLEFLPYTSGHIGDVFIGLLEAINYIKEKLKGNLPNNTKDSYSA